MSRSNPTYSGFGSRFFKGAIIKIASGLLVLWVLLALFASFLANPLPLSVTLDGKAYRPFFGPEEMIASVDSSAKEINWKARTVESARWSLIPYGTEANRSHQYFSPIGTQIPKGAEEGLSMRFRHWMGTDRAGRDVLAMLIHGSRTALLVSFIAITLAGIIGICVGVLMGYLGDQGYGQSLGVLLMAALGLIPAIFYGFQVRYFTLLEANGTLEAVGVFALDLLIFFGIMALFIWMGRKLGRIPWLGKKVPLPLDLILSRLVEILDSLPALLLIISLSALFSRSLWFMIIIMALVSWTGLARLIRGEILKVRSTPYIEAAKAMGLTDWQVIRNHILPNAFPPVLVILVLMMGNVILAEASLGFLGLIEKSVSWGSLLNHAREDGFGYWWVILFPGMFIFLVVMAVNMVGERIRDVLDPRTS